MHQDEKQIQDGLLKIQKAQERQTQIEDRLNSVSDIKLKTVGGRGKGAAFKPLLESEIREAQAIARSASEAARILNVAYTTYKKYAKLYGIFENLKNPDGIGISKGWFRKNEKYSIEDILEGKHPNYPGWKLKRRLINNGYMDEACSVCGFNERRIVDYKVPLFLDHIDDDKTNHKYENLRFLCHNCTFLIKGNFNIKNFKEMYF